jgi:predicted porin
LEILDMKKSLLALAVLSAFAGAASAQSSVTLSGRVDAGIIRSGAATGGSQWTMGGSQSGYNALTFSGREDLGGGMNAFFTLNHRFRINTGEINNPGGASNFYRNVFVGLGGGFGDVRLGRMLMPLQEWNGAFDAFDTGYVASTHTGGINATVRATNTIYYRSPSMGGLFVHAAIAAGENQIQGECGCGLPATPNTTAERPTGFALGYASGPIRAVVAYDRNATDQKTTGLYAGFNAGFANFMGQYERGDKQRSAAFGGVEKVGRWSLSAKVPLGAVTLKAGYTRWSDEDVKKLGVGAQYDLSKRTNLYTDIGKVSGDGNTKFGAVSSAAKKMTFDIGVTHAF